MQLLARFRLPRGSGRLAAMASVALLAAACRGESPEALMQSARDYHARADHQAAVIQLKNLLQAQPRNAEARLLLGKALLETQDPVSAEKELRRALEYGATQEEVLPPLARALAEQDRHGALLSEFGDARLRDPRADAEFRTLLGDALLRARRRDDASAAYAAALAALPAHAAARLGQARIAAVDGRVDEAVRITDEVIGSGKSVVEAYMLKANLLLAIGERDGARKAMEQAVAQRPSDLPIRLALAALLLDVNATDAAAGQLAKAREIGKGDLRVTYFEGMLALRRGNVQQARDLALQVLKAAPDHVPSLLLAGAAELRLNQALVAESHLRKALTRAPDHAGARRLLVAAYLKGGNASRALEVLQPLVENQQVDDPRLLLLAGETYLANGDVARASTYFGAASKVDAVKGVARTRLGQIALATGRVDEGFRELEAAAEQGADHQADLSLIAGYLRTGAPDKALAAAVNLEKKLPANPLAAYVLGLVHTARKDAANARAHLNRALELNAGFVPAAVLLANLDIAEKKPAAAIKRFEAMAQKQPGNEAVLLAMADAQARTGAASADIAQTLQRAQAANPQSVAARVALVNHFLRLDDPRSAVKAAQDAVAAIPGEARLLEVLAVAHDLAGETDAALAALNRLVALQPAAPQPLQKLASLHVKRKANDAAIDALRRAQKLAPTDRTVARDLAAVFVSSGRFDEALREARVLQTRDPKFAGGFLLEGDVHARQKKWADAERAWRAALKLDPRSEAIAGRIHTALASAGRHADADAFVRKWIAENPPGTGLRLQLAEQALRMKDFRSAVRHYQAVVAQEPQNVVALNNLAWASGELGDPKAVGYAERAVKLAPNNAAVLDTMGMLLVRRGAVNDGLVWLERARHAAPSRADLRLNYARALLQAGRRTEARRELEALQNWKHEFTGKDQVAELLKSV